MEIVSSTRAHREAAGWMPTVDLYVQTGFPGSAPLTFDTLLVLLMQESKRLFCSSYNSVSYLV